MIGVLLITHDLLGKHLVETLTGMLGQLPLSTETLEIRHDHNPEDRVRQTAAAIARLDRGDGVLLITDAYGSTPSNIANDARQQATGVYCRIIAGVNLPMLIRIYNYPQLALDAAMASAIEAGRNGIVCCDTTPT